MAPTRNLPSPETHPEPPVDPGRGPVLLLWGCAVGWLFLSSVLGLIGSMKFHAPDFLADHAWLTYGRIQPAQAATFLYGFVLPAGLGIMAWMLPHLGRTRLRFPGLVMTGALLWNVGVGLGVAGILAGLSTGFPGLELPPFAFGILFGAYALVGLSLLWTFVDRRGSSLYVSQWFLLAAIFWFPWILSTAGLLLLVIPVRGMLQALVNAWYASNLWVLWCGAVGLGVLFYLLPRRAHQPLNSYGLALTAFWTLLFFGPWVGIPDSLPLPAWISGLSTVFALLLIVPLLAVALNWHRTLAGQYGRWRRDRVFRLALFAAAAWSGAMVMLIATALPAVGATTQFTFFHPAQARLFGYGFFAVTVFAALYEALPGLLGAPLPSARLVTVHVGAALLGVLLWVLPLAAGGIAQGLALKDPQTPFLDTLGPALTALRVSTLGDFLWLTAHGALLVNFGWAILRVCRSRGAAVVTAALAATPAEERP